MRIKQALDFWREVSKSVEFARICTLRMFNISSAQEVRIAGCGARWVMNYVDLAVADARLLTQL